MAPIQSTTCKGCHTHLQGPYCHRCGEKRIEPKDKRITFFIEELISSLFVADGKFFKTMRLLLTRPGELTKSFVDGVRKKYLSPLQLFFFANLIYFLFPLISTFNTSLDIQMYNLPYSDWVRPVVENYLEQHPEDATSFRTSYEATSNSNGKLLLILLVLLQGLFLKLLFLRDRRFYLIDFFAGSAYFYGFYILVFLVAFPSLISLVDWIGDFQFNGFLNELTLSVLFLVGIFTYQFFLIKKAYSTGTADAIWRSVLLAAFIIPSFTIYRFLLFWVTFWMAT
ncbi:DUF3667 domain-containing protein [Algoriphagus confluentis]|uniref:DUF3667 domain-containing protein n=1 Tax=Algoriphagus confluentis TaxID=1697556 RepID=A0ABQ6PRN1_9BACT|nr:hypothetical protein Aconfl_29590 [Algoriphagus confluentis]